MKKNLTKNQRLVLRVAAGRNHLAVDPLPDELGAAGPNTVAALLKAGLLVAGKTAPLISMPGFEALRAEPNAVQLQRLDELAGARTGANAPAKPGRSASTRTGRKSRKTHASAVPDGATKQAKVVAMLSRPAGATVDQVARALRWRPHTVRGVIAGVIKKKLGLRVTSEKNADGARLYRIR
jgi:hypothetical protein